jgi:hypothetical protein
MLLVSSHLLKFRSVKAFFESIKKCYDDTSNSKPCDVLAIVFSGVIVMADIATIGIAARVVIGLKAFQKTYLLAIRIEQALEAASAAGKVIGNKISAVKTYFKNLGTRAVKTSSNYFEGVLDFMKNKLSNYWDDLPSCGEKCAIQAEDVMTKEGELFLKNADNVGEEVTDGFGKAQTKGFTKQCILGTLSDFFVEGAKQVAENLADDVISFSFGYIMVNWFGIQTGGANVSGPGAPPPLRIQASGGRPRCYATELEEGILGNRKHAPDTKFDEPEVLVHKPDYVDVNKKKFDANLLRFFSAHHIAPATDNCNREVANTKIKAKVQPSDIVLTELPFQTDNPCKDMRDVLAQVGINHLIDPCNGVLLPDTGTMSKAVNGTKRVKPTVTLIQIDEYAEAMVLLLKGIKANPRDHVTIHSNRAFNTINRLFFNSLLVERVFTPNNSKTDFELIASDTNKIKVCAALQLTANRMFFGESIPKSPVEGFTGEEKVIGVGIPSFFNRVADKIKSKWAK